MKTKCKRVLHIRDNSCLGFSYSQKESLGKRGMLLAEFTLKTVLAVIGILLLVYLLALLYATFSKERELGQAQGSLERLFEGIVIAATGTHYPYVLTVPKSWKVLWYADGIGSVAICQGVPCLCICKQPHWYSFSSQQTLCASAGVCRAVGVAFSMPADIAIDGPTSVVLQADGGVVRLTRA